MAKKKASGRRTRRTHNSTFQARVTLHRTSAMRAIVRNRPNRSRRLGDDRNAPTAVAPEVVRAGRLPLRSWNSDGVICRR